MLEKMSDFFEARLDVYDEHMLTNIESASEFYPFTASLLPTAEHSTVLDLGCGTGLELEKYYKICPTARVTGIDLSAGMLDALKSKFPDAFHVPEIYMLQALIAGKGSVCYRRYFFGYHIILVIHYPITFLPLTKTYLTIQKTKKKQKPNNLQRTSLTCSNSDRSRRQQ